MQLSDDGIANAETWPIANESAGGRWFLIFPSFIYPSQFRLFCLANESNRSSRY